MPARDEPARLAGEFHDSVGVATHLRYEDTPYARQDLVKQRLLDLGVRHIRDGWGPADTDATGFMRDLAASGIKVTFVHDPRNGASLRDQHRLVADELLSAVAAAESLNEWDMMGAGWERLARQWTVDLSETYRGDARTRAIPIVGPSLADVNDVIAHRALGDLSAAVDFGNVHNYPGDDFAMNDEIIDSALHNQRTVAGPRPVVATETGYSNGSLNAPYPVMPEEQVAVLLPRLYLEHFRRGLPRTFAYELLDEKPDRSFESGFGLLRHDGSPKPSYVALRKLLELTKAASAMQPGRLAYVVEGANDETRSLVLQVNPTRFLLILWQQVDVWDGERVLDPPDVPVTVRLLHEVQRVVDHRLEGAQPPTTTLPTNPLSVSVSEHVRVLELEGVSAPLASESAGPC